MNGQNLIQEDANGYPLIKPNQQFYMSFDATNTGTTALNAFSFVIPSAMYDPGPPIKYIYASTLPVSSQPKMDLEPGHTTNVILSLKITTTTCSGIKGYVINGATIVGRTTKINVYESGSDCSNILRTDFNYLDINGDENPDHPAYIKEDVSLPKYFGYYFKIKNNDISSFIGTYKTYENMYDSSAHYSACIKTGPINLQPEGEIEIEMPVSQNCPIGNLGYIILSISNANGIQINIINESQMTYYTGASIWSASSAGFSLNSITYSPKENANLYEGVGYVKSNTESQWGIKIGPLLQPLQVGSVYHIKVVDPSKLVTDPSYVLYENGFTVPNNLLGLGMPLLGYSTSIASPSFTMPDQYVPDSVTIMTQFIDPNGQVIFGKDSNSGYGYLTQNIQLTPTLICDTILNSGCACTSTTKNNIYEVICNLRRTPALTLAKKYIGRFIFDQRLGSQLQNRFIGLTTNPIDTTLGALDFSHSIQFITTPKPSSTSETTYTFDFKCDLDGDGYLPQSLP